MATARSEELRAVAQRFAEALPDAFDEVLLTGSVSRGDADELSDIEMLVVAREVPPSLPGIELYQEDYFENGTIGWYTALFDGAMVEFAGWTHERADGRLAGILAGEMIDHTRFRWAEAVVHGIPLRSHGAIARWQERLAVYPGVTRELVRDTLALAPALPRVVLARERVAALLAELP